MENEKFKVIRIDSGKAVTSVKELRKYIQDLRDSLLQVQTDENQLKQTTDALSLAQETLADVTGKSAKEMSASETSIVGMRKEYKKLYDQYKLLSEEQRNSPLGKEMASNLSNLSNSINNANKGVGNFKDNIGRYTESMSKALGSVAGAFGGLSGPIKGASALFKGLNAAMGPVGIIIGALVVAFKALSNGIKGSSDTSARFGQTMAKLKGFIVPVTRAIEKLASVFVDNLSRALDFVNQKLQEFADKLNIKWLQNYLKEAEEAGKKTEEIERRRQQNQSYYNHMLKANKDDEVKIAQLRADAEDKTKHSIEERQAMLKEADRREQNIYKRKLAYAKEEYEIQLAVNNLTENVSADNERLLAEKYENMRQAELDYQNKRRGLIRQNNRLDSESEKLSAQELKNRKEVLEVAIEAANADKDLFRAAENKLKLLKEEYDESMLISSSITDTTKREEYENDLRIKYGYDQIAILDEYYQKLREYGIWKARTQTSRLGQSFQQDNIRDEFTYGENYVKHLQNLLKEEGERFETGFEEVLLEFTDKQKEVIKKTYVDARNELWRKVLSDTSKYVDDLESGAEKYAGKDRLEYEQFMAEEIVDIWEGTYETLQDMAISGDHRFNFGPFDQELLKQYEEQIEKAKENLANAEYELAEYDVQARKREIENEVALISQSSISYLKAMKEAAKWELEQLRQKPKELDEDFYDRRLAAQKKFNDASAALNAQYLSNLTETMTAIGSLLGSGGDAWEEYINLRVSTGKLTNDAAEKEFEHLKAYRYSETVLNTLAGAIAAYTSAQSLGVPWGPIIGGANAAAVTAAGAAQIMKISQTHFGSGSVDSTIKAGQTRYNDGYIDYANGRSTGTSELTELNRTVQTLSKQVKDVKVIVTEGDVTRMQNLVQAKVAEASW